MKQEILFRAVGEVGDDLIARADRPVQKNKTVWLRWAAMAACCILVIGIAAFARVTLSGAKSAAPEANMPAAGADTAAPETPRSIEPETAMAEEKSAETAENSEEYKSEPADVPAENDCTTPQTTAPSDAPCRLYAFRFDGRLYTQIPADGVDVLPGEQLGTVEESDVSELIGCAVYACDGAEPSYRVLLLLDGEYLPFEHTEPDGE